MADLNTVEVFCVTIHQEVRELSLWSSVGHIIVMVSQFQAVS